MFCSKVISVIALSLSLFIPISCVAEIPSCVSGQAVYRDTHGQLNTNRKLAVESIFASSHSDSRHILTKIKSNHSVIACHQERNPCYKGYRLARSKGFSTFRRLKTLSCDPNYVLHIDKRKKSKPTNKLTKLVNDSLLKRLTFFNTTKLFNIGVYKTWAGGVRGGAEVFVGIIDTGIDYTHPDLFENVRADLGRNFVDADGTPESITTDGYDDNGHGTHVAGTIGAMGNNGIGVVGINWKVSMIPLKFLDASGSGTLFGALQAIEYANDLTRQGINIIATNNSWGGGGYSQAMVDAISEAQALNILFIAAAGNEANDNDSYPSYPASYSNDNIISVAALDSTGEMAYFSNYGPNSVDIAAPGVSIASTYPGSQYAYLSGTSMATPHVTGAAALLKSANPSFSWDILKARILSTSVQVKGLKEYVGGGRYLNVERAVKGKTSSKRLTPEFY